MKPLLKWLLRLIEFAFFIATGVLLYKGLYEDATFALVSYFVFNKLSRLRRREFVGGGYELYVEEESIFRYSKRISDYKKPS